MSRFGIELENYVNGVGWSPDGGVNEIRSQPYRSYKELLGFVNDELITHWDQMILHSHPSTKNTSCSAHIHRSPTSFKMHDTLFKLINIYQFFFKNSPRRTQNGNFLSFRQTQNDWCDMVRIDKIHFDAFNRDHFALTPNDGHNTIEFRYNDFPKSMNQLSLYYYINKVTEKIISQKENYFEFKLIHLDVIEDLNKNIFDGYFSFMNPDSILLFNADYKDIMLYYSKDIETMFSKWRFYDFYSEDYKPFSKLIRNMFNFESKIFNKFFDSNWSYNDWSDFWKSRFIKDMPRTDLVIQNE